MIFFHITLLLVTSLILLQGEALVMGYDDMG